MGLKEDEEERSARREIEDFVNEQKYLARFGVNWEPDPVAVMLGLNATDAINAAIAFEAEAAAAAAAADNAYEDSDSADECSESDMEDNDTDEGNDSDDSDEEDFDSDDDVWDDWEKVDEELEKIEDLFTSASPYVPEGYQLDDSGWHFPAEIVSSFLRKDVTRLGIAAATRRALCGALDAVDDDLDLEINSLVHRLRNEDSFVVQCGSDLDGILYLWEEDIYEDEGTVTVEVRDEEMKLFLLDRMRVADRLPFRIHIHECSSCKESSGESSSTVAARKRRRRRRTRKRRRTTRNRRRRR